jgi:hypothetical protein
LMQHNVVSKIINKNVFMVKLSIFSWQTHVNMHIRGTFCTWMLYTRVYLSNTCTLNNSVLCFICNLYFSGTSKYAMFSHSFNQDYLRRPDKMPNVKPGQSWKERIRHLRQQSKGPVIINRTECWGWTSIDWQDSKLSGWQVNKGWSHYRTWRWRTF